MTQIEQIKAEIERLYADYHSKWEETRDPYLDGKADALDLLLSFIESLEKEKSEIPTIPALEWKRIKQGEKLPCRAYLYKLAYEQEGNFHGVATVDGFLVPNEPVRVGCDTWYLPADAIKNLPKEGQQ